MSDQKIKQCAADNVLDMVKNSPHINNADDLVKEITSLFQKHVSPVALNNANSSNSVADMLGHSTTLLNKCKAEHSGNADLLDLTKATITLETDLNNMMQSDMSPKDRATLTDQQQAMYAADSNAAIDTSISNALTAAQHYVASSQLEKAGEHVGDIQTQLNMRNKTILANLASDTMTATRVFTINQQNTIQANVVSGYMQLCSIFMCVAIVIIGVFALTPVQKFFKHSFVIAQILLVLTAVVLAAIIVYRIVVNDNHYTMLYQERVFENPDVPLAGYSLDQQESCPPVPTNDVPLVADDIIDVDDDNSQCGE
jgi:hypothetical protein